MKQILILCGLLLLMVPSLFGQTVRVTGRVTDATDGMSLPGVAIMIQGTTIGSVTDIEGNYSIDAPSNAVLVFSFVGMQTIEVPVNGRTIINVALEREAVLVDEFVVIGYGIQRREDATGAVSVVGARDFNRGMITSPQQLLAGRVSGVQVTLPGGAPGDGGVIRIRGGSSLAASNDPLIVIDGVPIENAGVPGTRNPLATINPQDIESFTVLKDASATAIFGARASNGVILITTRRGRVDTPLQISYTGTYSMSTIAKTTDVLSATEFRELMNQRFAGRPEVLGLLGNADTNWQDQIFQNAMAHDHALTATGALGFLPYRVSVGYSTQDGVLKTDNMRRLTGSVNLTPKLLDDNLQLTLSARGSLIENFFADQGAIGAALRMDPTQAVRDDRSLFGGYFTWRDGNRPTPGTANPVALLNNREDDAAARRFIGNFRANYRLPFLPDLRVNLNMAYDYSSSEGNTFTPDYAAWSYFQGGYVGNYWQDRESQLIDFYLNYNRAFEAIASHIDLTVGYSYQRFWNRGSSFGESVFNNLAFVRGHNPDRHRIIVPDVPYASEQVLIGFFGRLNYTLLDRYLFTFTLRNDHTSRFSPETRSGLFPSFAFAWQINEEQFMANADLFSELKLRAGVGITGQENIGLGDYPWMARYTRSMLGASFPFGDPNNFIQTIRPAGYDRNLRWEETTTFNVGLDWGILGHRYYGSLDFFMRETRNLINFIPVPAGTNLTNYITTNVGNMENIGAELSIFTRPVVTEDFSWLLGFNASWNKSEITKLTVVDDPRYLGIPIGGIAGGIGNNIQIHSVGFAPYSFFVFQQVYDPSGKPIEGVYVDRNGDGIISEGDLYHYQNRAPRYFMGLTSEFQYRDWTLSFAGRANIGNFVYNNVAADAGVQAWLFNSRGPYVSNVHREALTVGFNSAQLFSDYYVQDASFFKMDHITLSYNFGNIMGAGSNLVLSGIVQNAFVITQYEGIDPEIFGGIDNNFYPRPRNFVLSLNLQF